VKPPIAPGSEKTLLTAAYWALLLPSKAQIVLRDSSGVNLKVDSSQSIKLTFLDTPISALDETGN